MVQEVFHLALRRGRKIAKVAMARRLAVRLYWMWRKGSERAATSAPFRFQIGLKQRSIIGYEQPGSRREGYSEPSPGRERCGGKASRRMSCGTWSRPAAREQRSEEHTSEL